MKTLPFPGIASPLMVSVDVSDDGRETTVVLKGRLADIGGAILQPEVLVTALIREYEEVTGIKPSTSPALELTAPGGPNA